MRADDLVARLDRVKQTGPAEWVACCPGHDDKAPSMTVKERDDGVVLLHCFAGCDTASILAAMGIEFSDLYPEPLAHHKPMVRHPFSSTAVLRAIAQEAAIVSIVASDVARGEVSEDDRKRALLAAERIQEAIRYA